MFQSIKPKSPCYSYWVKQQGNTVRVTKGALAGLVGRLNAVNYENGKVVYRTGCQLHAEHRSVAVAYKDLEVVSAQSTHGDECHHQPCCCNTPCGCGTPHVAEHRHDGPSGQQIPYNDPLVLLHHHCANGDLTVVRPSTGQGGGCNQCRRPPVPEHWHTSNDGTVRQ